LLPFKLEYLAPLGYILAIVIVELVADFVLLSLFPIFRKELGGLLPASAFNCAVLGLVFINVQSSGFKFFGSVFYGFCAGLGFILVLFIAANAMERVRFSTPPNAFKGLPIALITSGIISLAFMGFTGMKIPY
jgi:electron transport complex protein RnfA